MALNAKSDLEDVERYQRYAKEESNEANDNLEKQKTRTNNSLKKVGESKKEASYAIENFNSLICYADDLNLDSDIGDRVSFRINSDHEKMGRIIITRDEEAEILMDLGIIEKTLSVKETKERLRIYKVELNNLSNAITSIASGSLVGLAAGGGAYLGVGYLATASTGAAISGLSGAAATNATLAWLGGGSLATGGLGMAGGMAVMGGLVAGPLLAIVGAVFAAKAAEKKAY